MGAYGGTTQASMSPNPIGNIADLNHDNVVNLNDFGLLSQDWQKEEFLLDTDLDLNGVVDINDLVEMGYQWLWQIELTQGLIAHWKLDGDATDSSGNEHNGTMHSEPIWITEGQIDGAIQLDGVDDYVEIADYKGITGEPAAPAARGLIHRIQPNTRILLAGEIMPQVKGG